jgi:hypothetical protein
VPARTHDPGDFLQGLRHQGQWNVVQRFEHHRQIKTGGVKWNFLGASCHKLQAILRCS